MTKPARVRDHGDLIRAQGRNPRTDGIELIYGEFFEVQWLRGGSRYEGSVLCFEIAQPDGSAHPGLLQHTTGGDAEVIACRRLEGYAARRVGSSTWTPVCATELRALTLMRAKIEAEHANFNHAAFEEVFGEKRAG